MLEKITILYSFDSSLTTWGIIVLFASIFWIWWRKPHPNFPPGSRGVPLFGVLPWMGKYPERVLKKWSQKHYGSVMSARFGMEDVVVLNTFEAVQQVNIIPTNTKYYILIWRAFNLITNIKHWCNQKF